MTQQYLVVKTGDSYWSNGSVAGQLQLMADNLWGWEFLLIDRILTSIRERGEFKDSNINSIKVHYWTLLLIWISARKGWFVSWFAQRVGEGAETRWKWGGPGGVSFITKQNGQGPLQIGFSARPRWQVIRGRERQLQRRFFRIPRDRAGTYTARCCTLLYTSVVSGQFVGLWWLWTLGDFLAERTFIGVGEYENEEAKKKKREREKEAWGILSMLGGH